MAEMKICVCDSDIITRVKTYNTYATYSWVSYMQNIGDVVDVCYTDENSD